MALEARIARALAVIVQMAVALLALWAAPAMAQGLQPVPALAARVIDQTATLDIQQKQALEAKLAAIETEKGSQVVVLMVGSTQPEDIASYANRVANDWKIGRKAVGDGVLVIVAKDDRKMRIEVAKTLEGAIPDIMAARIIDNAMKPRFRQNDFAGGLNTAVDQLGALIRGETLPEVKRERGPAGFAGGGTDFDWGTLGIFLFFGVLVASRVLRMFFGNKLGAVATGAVTGAVAFFITASLVVAALAGLVALLFTIFSSAFIGLPTLGRDHGGRGGLGGHGGGFGGGYGGGGFGSGGGGGAGGFSSGGGGDFGGGGASGDW